MSKGGGLTAGSSYLDPATKREVKYATVGLLLGVMAPLGWIIVRLLLFWQERQGLIEQILEDITRTPQQMTLYFYMCGGTALVLGSFGYFLGRATQQIHDRARDLDNVNREMAEQKAGFERRFLDLERSVRNFHGINADLVIVAAKTDPSERHAGLSLLVVERGMPGFERGRKLEKIGLHSQDTAELFFNDVRVPVANRLGEEGKGFRYLSHNLAQERLSIAITR